MPSFSLARCGIFFFKLFGLAFVISYFTAETYASPNMAIIVTLRSTNILYSSCRIIINGLFPVTSYIIAVQTPSFVRIGTFFSRMPHISLPHIYRPNNAVSARVAS
jgi:hypothetical protein